MLTNKPYIVYLTFHQVCRYPISHALTLHKVGYKWIFISKAINKTTFLAFIALKANITFLISYASKRLAEMT